MPFKKSYLNIFNLSIFLTCIFIVTMVVLPLVWRILYLLIKSNYPKLHARSNIKIRWKIIKIRRLSCSWLTLRKHHNLKRCRLRYYKRPTGLNGHLSIRDYTDFLSEGLIFVYQQPHHTCRINENQWWYRKAAS